MLRHVKNFWAMSRPLNAFITLVSVWIAAFISPQFHLNRNLFLGSVIAALVASGANIINDIFDLEIDRINKPKRLLPSGQVSPKEAWLYFGIAYALAFLLSLFCTFTMFVIAVIIACLLIIYSARLKRTVLWGNITVSVSSAMAFIYGALTVGDWRPGLIPAIFAFFFHLGREIIKDMQDLEGDLRQQSVTFPGRFGVKASVALVNAVFIFLIILTFLPYILHIYGNLYLWIVILGVDSVLLFTSIYLWFHNDPVHLGKISHLLKLDMFIGLIAIYFGI
jgi:geranylgeranylglycerol-phosphate geranylgeranyltransferase